MTVYNIVTSVMWFAVIIAREMAEKKLASPEGELIYCYIIQSTFQSALM